MHTLFHIAVAAPFSLSPAVLIAGGAASLLVGLVLGVMYLGQRRRK